VSENERERRRKKQWSLPNLTSTMATKTSSSCVTVIESTISSHSGFQPPRDLGIHLWFKTVWFERFEPVKGSDLRSGSRFTVSSSPLSSDVFRQLPKSSQLYQPSMSILTPCLPKTSLPLINLSSRSGHIYNLKLRFRKKCVYDEISWDVWLLSQVSIELGLCEMLNSVAIRRELAPKDGKFDFTVSDIETMFPEGMVDHNVDMVYKEVCFTLYRTF